ncbi:DUF1707 SHOCT-like domain-containing protein [Bailinhaonella thermotolerans]|uniref:DUF1707 and DUF2154 domain-containing protein n=1 Tax=Bailinhaonella thermotolerans TaxID=1070861 RepID=A0A3A4B025_9ACTN|nr:DUF1707 domain-containing protein [Bailinhaonella thermotolerans]RJL34189.1 DUF1707 and DUF2154 domain-containing protein [Bailinhaonella thermotolerans]
MSQHDELRVSDAEREETVERLRVASVEGRLSFAELSDRTEAAYGAVTRADLVRVTADLPDAPGAAAEPVRAPGRARRWFVAILGDTRRRGHWKVDKELAALAVLGDVVLDLRQAQVLTDSVDIVATAVLGDVKVIVPDGVDVDVSGVAVLGDKKIRVEEAPAGRRAPVVRVRATALLGDVKVYGHAYAERKGSGHSWHH